MRKLGPSFHRIAMGDDFPVVLVNQSPMQSFLAD
jgi:hypothetical protein